LWVLPGSALAAFLVSAWLLALFIRSQEFCKKEGKNNCFLNQLIVSVRRILELWEITMGKGVKGRPFFRSNSESEDPTIK
jgi:hypothetical protein